MTGPWIMHQQWRDLLFAHWPYAPDLVRPLLPPSLPLDTFDGQAWIGVVPFHMTGVRPRGLPPVPTAHAFPELNVRTYARVGDRAGVWFFSLDAASTLAVWGARAGYSLPYFRARMRVEGAGTSRVRYDSRRTHRGAPLARFVAEYGPAGAVTPAAPGSLDEWLTQRLCLFAADRRGRLWRTDIAHARWPLQPASCAIAENSMVQAAGLPGPSGAPLLHFSRFLPIRAGLPHRVT